MVILPVGRYVGQVEPHLVPEPGLVPAEDGGRAQQRHQLRRGRQVQRRQLLQHHYDRTQLLAQVLLKGEMVFVQAFIFLHYVSADCAL